MIDSILKEAQTKFEDACEQFRAQRMMLFRRFIERVPKPATLLDLGGTPDFWEDQVPDGLSITLFNVLEQQPLSGVRIMTGDACDLVQFGDRAFDIVYSNSVLGHVGDWDRQRQMAREIRRVGARYFVQTPNHGFPIDWRTLVPFFHWLRPATQAWCLQRFRVGRYQQIQDKAKAYDLAARIRNVTRAELSALFPEGTILSERVLGCTKSFMVHHGFE